MRLDMLASWRPSPLLPSLLPRHCDADGLFGRDAMIHALGGLGDGQLHPFDCSGEGFATYVPDMRRSMPPGSGSDRAANAASAHVLDVLVVRERQGHRQREGLTSLCKVAALQPAVRGKKIEAGFLRLGVSGAPGRHGTGSWLTPRWREMDSNYWSRHGESSPPARHVAEYILA